MDMDTISSFNQKETKKKKKRKRNEDAYECVVPLKENSEGMHRSGFLIASSEHFFVSSSVILSCFFFFFYGCCMQDRKTKQERTLGKIPAPICKIIH